MFCTNNQNFIRRTKLGSKQPKFGWDSKKFLLECSNVLLSQLNSAIKFFVDNHIFVLSTKVSTSFVGKTKFLYLHYTVFLDF